MDFTNEIKDWVAVDNKVRLYNEKIKELRQERTQIAENILSYANTNNLGNAVIEISDGKLKFNQSKVTSPLTFKFIKSCLNDCIQNQRDVDKIIDYIKEKRDFYYVKEIKRLYSKNT
jgi:hypothetical protein|tara:strand:+ start:399 stop:749 length:351 start_codon:yes stop_codon:yes gene_type:complete